MKDVWLEDPLGERKLAPSELPLTVGGAGAAVVIPGCRSGELRARVALTEHGIAVTPEPGAGPDALDGVHIEFEDRAGRPTIVVRHGGVANVTRPPQADAHAGDAIAGDRQPDRGRGLPAACREVHDAVRGASRRPAEHRHRGPRRGRRGALLSFHGDRRARGLQSRSGPRSRELRGHGAGLRVRRPLSRAARQLRPSRRGRRLRPGEAGRRRRQPVGPALRRRARAAAGPRGFRHRRRRRDACGGRPHGGRAAGRVRASRRSARTRRDARRTSPRNACASWSRAAASGSRSSSP